MYQYKSLFFLPLTFASDYMRVCCVSLKGSVNPKLFFLINVVEDDCSVLDI